MSKRIGCLPGFLIIGGFTIAIVVVLSSFGKTSSQSAAPPESKQVERERPTSGRTGRKFTKGGFVASPSEELLDKAIRYANQKDGAAFRQLIRSGMVIELKEGIPVEIMDTTFTGKIKIRPRGQTIELWTVVEAVRGE